MAIIRTIPAQKIINGEIINTSEVSLISELEYSTNGEDCIITMGVSESIVILNSKTTDHIVVKSMIRTTIRPDVNRIDEDYDEILLDRYACVEFRFCGGSWYILSSDGLKQS
jgi:hypothetical protein